MSKVVVSPVKRFPGTVTLRDPIPLPLCLEWRRTIDAWPDGMSEVEAQNYIVPVLIHLVEAWHLERFPEQVALENFPGSPSRAAAQLIAWLMGEVGKVFKGEEEIPLEP